MYCDGAIRNIEKEILRECANTGIEVHENFLNYYIKLLVLDPKWGISTSAINRNDVQTFIRFVVNKLKDQLTPSMIVLKMQYYFICNFQMKAKMVKRNRVELLNRLKPLQQELFDLKKIDDCEEDIEGVYKKIVYYITLASGLGNPTLEPVYKEVRAALGSILDPNELKDFIGQPKFTKEEQLQQFTKLVTGIRLFNKDCGKGGEGMEDLPELINGALDATNTELQTSLVTIMDKVNLMTTALDYVYQMELDERHKYYIATNLPKGMTMADVEYVRDSLIVYRQHELYVRKIIDEVDKIETISNQIFTVLQNALLDLHQVVRHRIAIPVNQVFPHFNKLSDIWCALQDQTVLLAKLNQIMITLHKYIKLLSFNDSIAEMMIPPGENPMTDIERMERTIGEHISQEGNYTQVMDVLFYKNVDQVRLEYLGFCAWKLSATEGALLPGNPNLGICKIMNMNFVFSTVEAGHAFGTSPEKIIMETIKLARRKPELIHLLGIRNQVTLVQGVKELVIEPPLLPLTNDAEIQTEVHPIEENIDRTYCWNVWDLKRRTIQLCNLQHCQTHSSQTLLSYHRVQIGNQTYDSKEQNIQTMKDNHTNVPTPSTFIFGLRGRKDDKQFIIDLTRPVDE